MPFSILIPKSCKNRRDEEFSSFGGISKNASTTASFSPLRITSVDALSPRARQRASIIIDLHAPVSPVRTLSPFSKFAEASSIMARFLIWSSRNMTLYILHEKCIYENHGELRKIIQNVKAQN